MIPKGDAALWKAKANEQARGRLEAWSRQRAKKEKVKTEVKAAHIMIVIETQKIQSVAYCR